VNKNQQRTAQAAHNIRQAIKHDNPADAIKAYGRSSSSFYSAMRRHLTPEEREDANQRWAKAREVQRREHAAKANAKMAAKFPYGGRNDDLIEDAEFLARHGVIVADAVRRLGFDTAEALERRLRRAGAPHVWNRLMDNDPFIDDRIRDATFDRWAA
jgi:hypothetical protein